MNGVNQQVGQSASRPVSDADKAKPGASGAPGAPAATAKAPESGAKPAGDGKKTEDDKKVAKVPPPLDAKYADMTEKDVVGEWLDRTLAEEKLRDEARGIREKVDAAKVETGKLLDAVEAKVKIESGARTFVFKRGEQDLVVRVTKKGPTLVPPDQVS